MSPLVRGHDTYTALEMVIEAAYNTNPGSGYKRVPLLGEGLDVKRASFPKNREIGNTGAQAFTDQGRGWYEGTIDVYPRYNSIWFNQLLVHAFGGSEELGIGLFPQGGGYRVWTATVVNGGSGYSQGQVLTVAGGVNSSPATLTVTSVSGGAITGISVTTSGLYTTLPSNPAGVTVGTATFTLGVPVLSTHAYLPQSFKEVAAGSASGVAPGLTLRAWRSGQSTSGRVQIITGAIINGFKFTHPENDRPRSSFSFIGQIPTTADIAASGAGTLADVPAGEIPVRALDLKRNPGGSIIPGLLKIGSDLSINPDIVSWELDVKPNLEFAPAFLNSPDAMEKPGHVDKWLVTGKIGMLLQQSAYTGKSPHADFEGKLASALRVRYVSESFAYQTIPYAMDFYLKNIAFTKVTSGITGGGAPKVDIEFEAALGTFTTSEAGLTSNLRNTLLVQTVGQAAAYATSAEGGNVSIEVEA